MKTNIYKFLKYILIILFFIILTFTSFLIRALITQKIECTPISPSYNISIEFKELEIYSNRTNTISNSFIFEKLRNTEYPYDKSESNLIINKEKITAFSISASPRGYCGESEPTVNLKEKDLKITINGKNFFDPATEKSIQYKGNKIDTYAIYASWKNKFKQEQKYNIYWVSAQEFGTQKQKFFKKRKENDIEYYDDTNLKIKNHIYISGYSESQPKYKIKYNIQDTSKIGRNIISETNPAFDDIWINKDELKSFQINTNNTKDFQIKINNILYHQTPYEYTGKDIETYTIEMYSLVDEFLDEEKIVVHWLSAQEFEAKKQELIEKWGKNNIKYSDVSLYIKNYINIQGNYSKSLESLPEYKIVNDFNENNITTAIISETNPAFNDIWINKDELKSFQINTNNTKDFQIKINDILYHQTPYEYTGKDIETYTIEMYSLVDEFLDEEKIVVHWLSAQEFEAKKQELIEKWGKNNIKYSDVSLYIKNYINIQGNYSKSLESLPEYKIVNDFNENNITTAIISELNPTFDDIWIDRDKLKSFQIGFFNRKENYFSMNKNRIVDGNEIKNFQININNIPYFPFPYILSENLPIYPKTQFNYTGKENDTYTIKMYSLDVEFIDEEKIIVHWLSAQEFEAKKQELIEKWKENNIKYSDYTK